MKQVDLDKSTVNRFLKEQRDREVVGLESTRRSLESTGRNLTQRSTRSRKKTTRQTSERESVQRVQRSPPRSQRRGLRAQSLAARQAQQATGDQPRSIPRPIDRAPKAGSRERLGVQFVRP